MPTYLHRCPVCGTKLEVICRVDERDEPVWHCINLAERIIEAAMVAPSFKPYRAVTGDRRMVHDAAQHKAFLKDFNLVEVGDDKSMAPPPFNRDEYEALNKIQQSDLRQLEDAPTIADV